MMENNDMQTVKMLKDHHLTKSIIIKSGTDYTCTSNMAEHLISLNAAVALEPGRESSGKKRPRLAV
jgi:hypothetical protein